MSHSRVDRFLATSFVMHVFLSFAWGFLVAQLPPEPILPPVVNGLVSAFCGAFAALLVAKDVAS